MRKGGKGGGRPAPKLFVSLFFPFLCLATGKVRGQVPLLGYLGLLPIGAKIAIGLACVSWILYGLRADGATPKCDGDDDRITSRRWLLLLLCPVL